MAELEQEAELPCVAAWGAWDDCPTSASGHTCERPTDHDGRCRCDCGATAIPDPIFFDPEQLEADQEALDD